jgi:hypothetical protein
MKTKLKLGLDKMSVPQLLGYSTHAVSKMTGNSFFVTPSPALVKVTNATSALQNAFNLAQGAGPAQTAVMHQSRTLLETLLTALGHYVEDVANDPLNSSTGAEAIILSAGMELKAVHPRQKQTFGVDAGDLPGTVVLIAESIKRGAHQWQFTLDLSDPKAWTDAASTVQATTTLTGLEIGKRYSFRHRGVLPDGHDPWSDPESIIVT